MMHGSIKRLGTIVVFLGVLTQVVRGQSIQMEMADKESGEGIVARLRFTAGEKTAGLPRQLLVQGKWVLAEPTFSIGPKPGDFEFVVQRGPEFTDIRGGFTVEKGASDIVTVEVPRAAKMHEEHWYSGDHDCVLPTDTLLRWQMADAVDMTATNVSPPKESAKPSTPRPAQRAKVKKGDDELVLSETPEIVGLKLNTQSTLYHGEHGATLIHSLTSASNQHSEQTDFSRLMDHLESGENQDRVVELMQPWGRDVPILLATKAYQSVQVLNASLLPDGDANLLFDKEKNTGPIGRIQSTFGKGKVISSVFSPIPESERIRFSSERGTGMLSESLYWMMLDTGLRLSPTGGSGFGKVNTYVGYNRTYVFSEKQPDHDNYWRAVAQGKTLVTNGPLLRVSVNEMPPGSSFHGSAGEPIELSINASLSVRDPVDYLDVIFNGETLYSAKLEEHYQRGEFPTITIDKSGWLVVRVVTARNNVYRIASTAPYYFEFNNQPRIAKRAVEFFLEWLSRAERSLSSAEKNAIEYNESLKKAYQYWKTQLEQANAP